MQDPGWRNRSRIASANQGKGVGQFLGQICDNICKIGPCADPARKGCSYYLRKDRSFTGDIRGEGEVGKKACKGWRALEKPAVDGLYLRGQGTKGIDLVVEEACSLLAVADGIVQLIDPELVVLQQGMIGPFGKEQGGQGQRVDDLG